MVDNGAPDLFDYKHSAENLLSLCSEKQEINRSLEPLESGKVEFSFWKILLKIRVVENIIDSDPIKYVKNNFSNFFNSLLNLFFCYARTIQNDKF